MLNTPTTMDLPLHTDDDGVLRIRDTRITLHTIISTYKIGESPEDIHEAFPSITLADIYMLIAYYLANRETVDTYIQAIDKATDKRHKEIMSIQSYPTKSNLQGRLKTHIRK